MSSPTPTLGGQFLAAEDDVETLRYKEYLKHNKSLDLLPFPCLRIFLQPDVGPRIRVDQDPAYARITTLAQTIFTHIIGSSGARGRILYILNLIRPTAREALVATLGADREIVSADINDFLTHHTPAIVLKALRGKENEIIWGRVLKGDQEGANDNEMFLLLELAATLRDPVRTFLLVSGVEQR